jgi:hypothetical protein
MKSIAGEPRESNGPTIGDVAGIDDPLPITVPRLTHKSSRPTTPPIPASVHRRPPCRLESIPEGFPVDPFDSYTCNISSSSLIVDHVSDLETTGNTTTEHTTWIVSCGGIEFECTPQAEIIHPCDDAGLPWTPSHDPFAKDPPTRLSRGNAFFLSLPVTSRVVDYLKVDIPHISFPDMSTER